MLNQNPTWPFLRLIIRTTLVGLIGLVGLIAMACSNRFQSREDGTATVHDLDSLHRVAQYEDSVNANLFFYEDAFIAYQKTHPSVTKSEFMQIARGKDQAFCLFQPQPGSHCLKVGDQFIKLGLREPAIEAFEAGMLSEKFNGDTLNIKLWTSLAQMHYEAQELETGRAYLAKILEVDPNHKWAKKQLAMNAKPKTGK
jgi:tetratricopeptide (TPR) repeat protein